MKAIRLSLASILLASSAMAQALPQAEELAGRVGEQLPSYCSVADFRPIAQTKSGCYALVGNMPAYQPGYQVRRIS